MKHKLLAILAGIVILSAFCQGSSGKDRKSIRSEFAMPDSIHLGRGDLEQVIYETSVPGPTSEDSWSIFLKPTIQILQADIRYFTFSMEQEVTNWHG